MIPRIRLPGVQALSKQAECWKALDLGIQGLGLPLPLTDGRGLSTSPPPLIALSLSLFHWAWTLLPASSMSHGPQVAPVSISQTWTVLSIDKQTRHPKNSGILFQPIFQIEYLSSWFGSFQKGKLHWGPHTHTLTEVCPS